ncbi:hypothetical protein JOC54_002756 [Alkalihalobacillus xiaoxiensis]|uniref:Uncharacterized protein n=1 Tax=Shouchella xiaoxiensis TaxID=766895 RepID=A0ABS2SWD2_9BACI|nr:hypothetical protein [Shouchella xiaoxiensis]MBM7839476.1 hypothetical protein [Shouchella xiaoxiensis]
MKLAASIVLFMVIGVIVAYSFGIFMIGIGFDEFSPILMMVGAVFGLQTVIIRMLMNVMAKNQ